MCNSAVYLTLRVASCARDPAVRGEDTRTPQRQPFTQNGGAEWEAFLLSAAYAFVFIGLLHNNHRARQRAGAITSSAVVTMMLSMMKAARLAHCRRGARARVSRTSNSSVIETFSSLPFPFPRAARVCALCTGPESLSVSRAHRQFLP